MEETPATLETTLTPEATPEKPSEQERLKTTLTARLNKLITPPAEQTPQAPESSLPERQPEDEERRLNAQLFLDILTGEDPSKNLPIKPQETSQETPPLNPLEMKLDIVTGNEAEPTPTPVYFYKTPDGQIIAFTKDKEGKETPVALEIDSKGNIIYLPNTEQPILPETLKYLIAKLLPEKIFPDIANNEEIKGSLTKLALGEQLSLDQQEALARYFGFLTFESLAEILGIPPADKTIQTENGETINAREAIKTKLESRPEEELTPIEKAQKRVLEIIEQAKQEGRVIASGEEVERVLQGLLPESLSNKEITLVRLVNEIRNNLPEENRELFNNYLEHLSLPEELLNQQLGKISKIVDSYHQKIQNGEEVDTDLLPNFAHLIKQLFLGKQQLDEESKIKLRNNIEKTKKLGISLGAGIIGLLLLLVYLSMKGESQE